MQNLKAHALQSEETLAELQDLFGKIECAADLFSVVSTDIDIESGRMKANALSAGIDYLRGLYEKGYNLTEQMEKAQAAADQSKGGQL